MDRQQRVATGRQSGYERTPNNPSRVVALACYFFRFPLIPYANGAAATRVGQLVVNGLVTSNSFSATGSWDTWHTLDVSVWLRGKAANTISLHSSGDNRANIDELTVH